MKHSVTAAAALLLGLCALIPSQAHAEEWRWCSAGDLLDSGRTNGPNLVTRPFQADGAPDFQAQYEAYVRSIMGPIEGEFMLNCSPPLSDHDAAVKHNGEWLLYMHDATGGRFEAEDVFWSPVYASQSATDTAAPDSRNQVKRDPVAAESTQPTNATASAETQRAGAGAASKPLRFVLVMPMMPRAGDAHNPACYSNVITRPAPPGWGAPGFLPTGSAEQANRTIDSLKAAFIAKCVAVSGREAQSEGNFRSNWNQSERDEADLGNVRARFQEDVTVQMD